MVTIGEYTSFCKGVLWRENHNASFKKNLLTVEPYADLNREYTISLKRIFSVSGCLCPRIQ